MIILRQHEYTSVSRKIGAKLKRMRTNLANKVGRDLREDIIERKKVQDDLMSTRIKDPKLLKESIKEARDKYNARTISAEDYGLKCGGAVSSRFLKEEAKVAKKEKNTLDEYLGSKLGNIVRKNDNVIFLSGEDGNRDVAEHAHEVGHLKNDKNGGRINRIFNKLQESGRKEEQERAFKTAIRLPSMEKSGKRKKISEKYDSDIDKGIGLKEYFKRLRKGFITVREEKNASKNALKFLKEKGASKQILDSSKDKLGKSLDTYRSEAKIYRRLPLQNMLQIKSRRRK